MNSSYLSFQPNDYFWASVKDEFDFSVCKKIFEEDASLKKKPSFLLTGIIEKDSSCNCPTTIPAMTTTPSITTGVTKIPLASTDDVDEYTKQICYNYIYSKKLGKLQNETSASQMNFSDNNIGYSKLIRQTFNVSIGIIAIIVAIGYS